ncbi:TraR/DksA family transcriptional regulator [Streptomyces ficellus]|uniref:Molecular chaperone DnaK n=1 Tax=Streptomyces ficellus TaxID=1977088 RepID=A0A6I6FNS0_9ACTN|nr:TraR/DksA C4-type zinc finger protein [Streptomyces ficellus]QGV81952.1 molecular chaperone DnaK [Streptomyces ficellus]
MSLDSAARAGSAVERFSVHEARQRLEHERHARLTQLQAVGEASGGAPEAHDLQIVQRGAIEHALKDIDAALARLQQGTYGTCQGCDRPIPVERLEILPYARCCVPCQQRAG